MGKTGAKIKAGAKNISAKIKAGAKASGVAIKADMKKAGAKIKAGVKKIGANIKAPKVKVAVKAKVGVSAKRRLQAVSPAPATPTMRVASNGVDLASPKYKANVAQPTALASESEQAAPAKSWMMFAGLMTL